jgi:hypothetical protein
MKEENKIPTSPLSKYQGRYEGKISKPRAKTVWAVKESDLRVFWENSSFSSKGMIGRIPSRIALKLCPRLGTKKRTMNQNIQEWLTSGRMT